MVYWPCQPETVFKRSQDSKLVYNAVQKIHYYSRAKFILFHEFLKYVNSLPIKLQSITVSANLKALKVTAAIDTKLLQYAESKSQQKQGCGLFW